MSEEKWKEPLRRSEMAWIAIIFAFVLSIYGLTAYLTFAKGIALPSSRHRAIDPEALEGFRPRAIKKGDGLEVDLLASQWQFTPAKLKAKAGQKIIMRLTSADVVHGFRIINVRGGGTTVNTMIFPGLEETLVFVPEKAGKYLFLCNEYCGELHYRMYGIMEVE